MLRHACAMGLEGIISKRRDCPYRSGRVKDWLKAKCTNRQEFVIAGYVLRSDNPRAVGALVVGYFEDGKLTYAGQLVRASPPMWGDLSARASSAGAAPRLSSPRSFRPPIAKASFGPDLSWSPKSSSGAGRAMACSGRAAFKGLREDKDVRDVLREQPRTIDWSFVCELRSLHCLVRVLQSPRERLNTGDVWSCCPSQRRYLTRRVLRYRRA